MNKNYLLNTLALIIGINLFAQTTLTQSADPITINTTGIACTKVIEKDYVDNSFYRVYKLSDFGISGDFEISSLEFGQGKARDGKELTLNIYTVDTDDLFTASFGAPIASTSYICSSGDNNKLISVALSVNIPTGSIIAFEIFAAENGDGLGSTDTTEDFLPGFNSGLENDHSYLQAPVCFANKPTTLTNLGFSNNRYVMNIVGSEVLGVNDFNAFKLSISPNPTKDIITIDTGSSNAITNMNLYNITGQLLQKSIKLPSVDLSELKSGIYLLEVSTIKGKATRKVIKR
ncbi:T9SS type A sorting domain-containing protein [uncultured Algibacter sp.]|uniref:T9SS type A sorting domain-containing protein n=1 Tax=uncultured Algibacter sp. TaxID=298659 RepID=UPI00261E1008|nr:T9SS type A sorting domain-containing protein [uncultured Algibacter sp.]